MRVRQFIAVRFDKGSRTYTYHNDGEAARIGDRVKVPGRFPGDGWQAATVVDLVNAPGFSTKEILGVIPRELSAETPRDLFS